MTKKALSVFDETYWDDERPCFVKEEKKVLDVVYALLLVSSQKHDVELALATKTYSQKLQGLNEPIQKIMCRGPILNLTVGRENYIKDEDYWKYVHYGDELSNQCQGEQNVLLQGPVSSKDTSIAHPCNLGTCWVGCMCSLCQNTREMKCKNHKDHIKFNMKRCKIIEISQCQDH